MKDQNRVIYYCYIFLGHVYIRISHWNVRKINYLNTKILAPITKHKILS